MDRPVKFQHLFCIILVRLEEPSVEELPVATEDVLGERDELLEGLELFVADQVGAENGDGVVLVPQARGVNQLPHLGRYSVMR